MEAITSFVSTINGIVWGVPMLIMILGVGLFLSIGLKLMPILKLGRGFKLLWSGRQVTDESEKGDVSPFNALMTSLSATIGTGNIAGVATAILLVALVRYFGCGVLRLSVWRPSFLRRCLR